MELRKDLPTKSARAILLQRGSAHCGVTGGDRLVKPSEFDRGKPMQLSEERGTTSRASSKLMAPEPIALRMAPETPAKGITSAADRKCANPRSKIAHPCAYSF